MGKQSKVKIYCALTHNGVYTTNSGQAIPCCVSRVKPSGDTISENVSMKEALLDRLNIPVIRHVRESLIAGIWPDECNICKTQENNGVKSMRQIYNDLISEPIELKSTVELKDVKTLHLGVGNKCNSRCMTCQPHSSDYWIPEYEYIHDTKFTKKYIPILDQPENLENLVNILYNLERITFLGGEPSISDKYHDMLNAFIKTGSSKKIDLGFVTNLTTVDDMINDWMQFKSVDIAVSIDGFDKVNEYIRYPIRWEKTVSNLKTLLSYANDDSFKVSLSLTPSVYNCLHLDEILHFWYNITTRYFEIKPIIILNKVSNPISASMRVLPLEYRKIGINKLLDIKNIIDDIDIYSVIDSLIIELNEPELPDREHHLDYLKTFINKSDQFRKRSIKDYIPELYEELYGK